MQIDLPATLNATYSQYNEDFERIDGPGTVIVSFGSREIVRLPALGEPVTYYDTELDRQAEEGIVEETVAHWLKEKLV